MSQLGNQLSAKLPVFSSREFSIYFVNAEGMKGNVHLANFAAQIELGTCSVGASHTKPYANGHQNIDVNYSMNYLNIYLKIFK